MSKSRKNKKYNPVRTAGSVRQRFLDNIWLSDSSVSDRATLHNADGRGKIPLGVPSSMRSKWLHELNTGKFKWTFIFFAFDAIEKDFSYAEVPASRPCSSVDLLDQVNIALNKYLGTFEHNVDAWGWVAIPSETVDVDANVLAWGEYFEQAGIYDLDKISRYLTIRTLGENQNGLSAHKTHFRH